MIKRKLFIISILLILFSAGFLSLARLSSGIDNEISISTLNSSSLDYTNATVISDSATPWNTGTSNSPKITIDISGTIHVVWEDTTDGAWGTDYEIMYASNSGSGWTNATVISDDGTNWNDGNSLESAIAVDSSGTIHVIWYDGTDGAWGTDYEIMYASNSGSGWTNATVISDDGTNWNDGNSEYPDIAVDSSGTIHVIWEDTTDGAWGTDYEIMYASNSGSGWTNATVISDDGTNWNDGTSEYPDIAVDSSGNIHVVWEDDTVGAWGTDVEIMYAFNNGSGWTKATVISDIHNGIIWNDGDSNKPTIAVDRSGTIHVVWYDLTDGAWGTDNEIMYASNSGSEWSLPYVISDDDTNWNDGNSEYPDIAIDNKGKAHVVWHDSTDGAWGTDIEIMYTSFTAFIPSSGGGISFGYTSIFLMIIGIVSVIVYTKKKL